MDQLFGQQHAPGLGHRDRRGAQVLAKQAPKLALAHPQSRGQPVDIGLVQRAGLDQAERPRDRVGGAAPGAEVRRGLRPAAQAWPKPRLLRRRRGRIEGDVFPLGRARRADRPAVDAGRAHADKEASVKAGVARLNGAVAGVVIEVHAPYMGAGDP